MILSYFVGAAMLMLSLASLLQFLEYRRKWIKLVGTVVGVELVPFGDSSAILPVIEFVLDGFSRKGLARGAQISENFVLGSKINIMVDPENPDRLILDSISGFIVPFLIASFALVMMYLTTFGGK